MFTPGSLPVPPAAAAAAAPALGLPEASKEAGSHLNQQDSLPPLLGSPCPFLNAQSPTLALQPLLGCMHCLYCTEKGRDSRSAEERMELSTHLPAHPARPAA